MQRARKGSKPNITIYKKTLIQRNRHFYKNKKKHPYEYQHSELLAHQPSLRQFYLLHSRLGGARCWWRSWLGHRATSRKVAGSIPDGAISPGVDSASSRNEYQEYFPEGKGGRCVGLTTLPPSCADCLEIWEPQPPGTLRACPGLLTDCFPFTFTFAVWSTELRHAIFFLA